MQQVTLTYTLNSTEASRTFNVYGVSDGNSRLVRVHHIGLDGSLLSSSVGHYGVVDVDFAPLGYDKAAAYFLYGFMRGGSRKISFEGTETEVFPSESSLTFNFTDGIYFLEEFRLSFISKTLVPFTDPGVTKTLKPTYQQGISSIVGNTWTVSVDLVDEMSVDCLRVDLSYITGAVDEDTFGYRHRFRVVFSDIPTETERDWLRTYCLCASKRIDTTDIDPNLGAIFTVDYDADELVYDMIAGVRNSYTAEISLSESTLRTDVEGAVDAPFILDQDTLDSKPLG